MIEDYIRQSATRFGIDPDIAVRVARSEGGLKDPVRQSLVKKNGVREPSYGPFQLLVGGGDTGFPRGMGNDALAAGIDPRDPNQWQRGVDFALQNAAKNGWGAWYGAKAAGIGNRQGLPDPGTVLGTSFAKPRAVGNPTSSPVSGGVDLAPPITTSKEIKDAPIAAINSDHMRADAMASSGDTSFFGKIADKMKSIGQNSKVTDGLSAIADAAGSGGGVSQSEAHNTPMPSNLGAVEAADASRAAAASQMMQALLQRRKMGTPSFGTSFVG